MILEVSPGFRYCLVLIVVGLWVEAYPCIVGYTSLLRRSLFLNYKGLLERSRYIIKHFVSIASICSVASSSYLLSIDDLKLVLAHPKALGHLLWSHSFNGMMELLLKLYLNNICAIAYTAFVYLFILRVIWGLLVRREEFPIREKALNIILVFYLDITIADNIWCASEVLRNDFGLKTWMDEGVVISACPNYFFNPKGRMMKKLKLTCCTII